MRKHIPQLALVIGLLSITAAGAASGRDNTTRVQPAQTPRIQVLFSPGGDCTDAIVTAIRSATASVDVQAYSFTSAPIAEAVARASERGVKVRVVLDKSQRTERYTSATYLHNHAVPVWIDAKHAIAHNKIILIDGKTIITGSFNFTKSAEERNAENLLIIEGHPPLVGEYQANFEEHLSHAEAYTGPVKKDDVSTAPPSRKPAADRRRKAA